MKEVTFFIMNKRETQRYARHFTLPFVGIEGQKKLKNAKVLCVGAGGLGSPALFYLAAAGVGTLGIIDNDVVDISNLQRQILFSNNDIGKNKSDSAKNKLIALNPDIEINVMNLRLNRDNALSVLAPYDVIVDCSDNFYARYVINDACFYLNKPNVYASILQFEAQCSVFSAQQGPCYRCIFPNPPSPELIPNCSESGVIGALPGIVGSIQAMEAIKLILNMGNTLSGRLLLIDAFSMQFKELALVKNQECSLCASKLSYDQLQMPDEVCHFSFSDKEITLDELKYMQTHDPHVCLLDVREQYEYDIHNLGGQLIPINQLTHRIHEVNKDHSIILVCQTGNRSKKAAKLLNDHGFDKIHILQGGITATLTEEIHS